MNMVLCMIHNNMSVCQYSFLHVYDMILMFQYLHSMNITRQYNTVKYHPIILHDLH